MAFPVMLIKGIIATSDVCKGLQLVLMEQGVSE